MPSLRKKTIKTENRLGYQDIRISGYQGTRNSKNEVDNWLLSAIIMKC